MACAGIAFLAQIRDTSASEARVYPGFRKGCVVRWFLTKLVLTGALLATIGGTCIARESLTVASYAGDSVALSALPPQARETYQAITRGGPFPFEKDGVVFGNRERQLPGAKRGYYREYTVRSPASHDRGPRRIVCGGALTVPDVCYYTADHYASFRQIAP
jgi:ribonuclease T1